MRDLRACVEQPAFLPGARVCVYDYTERRYLDQITVGELRLGFDKITYACGNGREREKKVALFDAAIGQVRDKFLKRVRPDLILIGAIIDR